MSYRDHTPYVFGQHGNSCKRFHEQVWVQLAGQDLDRAIVFNTEEMAIALVGSSRWRISISDLRGSDRVTESVPLSYLISSI